MNDKFTMEVTINPLVSPLLYERLGRCASARERATTLRTLAEATLLRELLGNAAIAYPAPVSPAPASGTTSRLPMNDTNMTEGLEALRAGNAADIAQALEVQLGNQLVGYFD